MKGYEVSNICINCELGDKFRKLNYVSVSW